MQSQDSSQEEYAIQESCCNSKISHFLHAVHEYVYPTEGVDNKGLYLWEAYSNSKGSSEECGSGDHHDYSGWLYPWEFIPVEVNSEDGVDFNNERQKE